MDRKRMALAMGRKRGKDNHG